MVHKKIAFSQHDPEVKARFTAGAVQERFGISEYGSVKWEKFKEFEEYTARLAEAPTFARHRELWQKASDAKDAYNLAFRRGERVNALMIFWTLVAYVVFCAVWLYFSVFHEKPGGVIFVMLPLTLVGAAVNIKSWNLARNGSKTAAVVLLALTTVVIGAWPVASALSAAPAYSILVVLVLIGVQLAFGTMVVRSTQVGNVGGGKLRGAKLRLAQAEKEAEEYGSVAQFDFDTLDAAKMILERTVAAQSRWLDRSAARLEELRETIRLEQPLVASMTADFAERQAELAGKSSLTWPEERELWVSERKVRSRADSLQTQEAKLERDAETLTTQRAEFEKVCSERIFQ